jgi:bis(5'-nucleosyl)-tetraphosphatase (symmetrical)
MATYAIGDIQGCHDELCRLLDELRFDPGRDKLWLVGDLVNRGPDSLKVLRFVRDLGERAVAVLGNHDLHLLALGAGNMKYASKSNLHEVLEAPDRDELLHWLRHRPLMHYDPKKGFALVHAGLAPQWDLPTALSCAEEVAAALRGPDYAAFLHDMYGNEPGRWSDGLAGMDRLRFITNCLTRLRYCTEDGVLALREKGPPGSQGEPCLPWFQVPSRATRGERIIFGHWSTLGYWAGDGVWGLDSGCLWGGQLTAIRVRRKKPPRAVSVACGRLAER